MKHLITKKNPKIESSTFNWLTSDKNNEKNH